MNSEIIVNRIREKAAAIRKEGATALYVYGSRIRGDNRPDSDLDVFVEYDRSIKGHFSLMELAGIKHIIEDETGLEVHITTRNSLHPAYKDEVEDYAVQVF